MALREVLYEHLKRCSKVKALRAAEKRDEVPSQKMVAAPCCLRVTVSVELTVTTSEILRLERNL